MNACCGSGPYNGNYNCGQTNEGGDQLYSLCEKPNDHVWWDAFHPNERMHEQLAKNIWDDPSSLVGPFKLKDLFLGSDKLSKPRRNDGQQRLHYIYILQENIPAWHKTFLHFSFLHKIVRYKLMQIK